MNRILISPPVPKCFRATFSTWFESRTEHPLLTLYVCIIIVNKHFIFSAYTYRLLTFSLQWIICSTVLHHHHCMYSNGFKENV